MDRVRQWVRQVDAIRCQQSSAGERAVADLPTITGAARSSISRRRKVYTADGPHEYKGLFYICLASLLTISVANPENLSANRTARQIADVPLFHLLSENNFTLVGFFHLQQSFEQVVFPNHSRPE